MRGLLESLWRDEDGLASVEYALLLAIIVIPGMVAWQALSSMICAIVEGAAEEFGAIAATR